MWKKDKKRIMMNEGDYGISLPITISGAEIAPDEKICFYIIDLNHMVVLVKEYTNIENNTFDLCLTKNESKKLNQGCYRYKIDWCKDDVFKGTIVESEIFEVRKDCVEGIAEEEEIVLNLQTKTAIPSKEQQSITYDEEYDALGEVIVEPIPEEYIKPIGMLEITENGKYDVAEKEKVNVNVGGFEINDASYLFYESTRLDTMNELLLVCKNVTRAKAMFFNCTLLTEIDLSGFDTSKVTEMGSMFQGCSALKKVNVSNFNTSNVTNMGNMFQNCSELTEVDISSFDTSKLTSSQYMFRNCSKLAKLIINNNNVFNMTTTSMLQNTPIASGTGYVYVPDDLVETYKTATNCSTYANQIKGMSELEATE